MKKYKASDEIQVGLSRIKFFPILAEFESCLINKKVK